MTSRFFKLLQNLNKKSPRDSSKLLQKPDTEVSEILSNYCRNIIQEVPKILSNCLKTRHISFKLLQNPDPRDWFKLIQNSKPKKDLRFFKICPQANHKISSNWFKIQNQKRTRHSSKLLQKQNKRNPRNSMSYFRNKMWHPQVSFRLLQKPGTWVLQFLLITSKTNQGISEILSNYSKNKRKRISRILSKYFRNKTHQVLEIFSNYMFQKHDQRAPRDFFKLLLKLDSRCPRDSFKLCTSKPKENDPRDSFKLL